MDILNHKIYIKDNKLCQFEPSLTIGKIFTRTKTRLWYVIHGMHYNWCEIIFSERDYTNYISIYVIARHFFQLFSFFKVLFSLIITACSDTYGDEKRSLMNRGLFSIPRRYRQYFMDTLQIFMLTSNENIFRVTQPLWGNSPVTGEIPSQRPVTRSLIFFLFASEKRLSKQSRRRWFETP